MKPPLGTPTLAAIQNSGIWWKETDHKTCQNITVPDASKWDNDKSAPDPKFSTKRTETSFHLEFPDWLELVRFFTLFDFSLTQWFPICSQANQNLVTF